MRKVDLGVVCEGNALSGGAFVPDQPKGAVLWLHGIPSSAPAEEGDRGYEGLAEDLAASGWASGWVDMRAVRTSQGYFSIEGWVRDAAVALQALRRKSDAGDAPTAIVGSSAGGCVAATVAARFGGVDALALLAAPAHWVSFAGSPQDAVTRISVDAGMAVAPEVEKDPAQWASEFDAVSTAQAIAEIDCPVLVVHGELDDVVPVSHADEIRAASKGAEVHVIPAAGHQLRKVPEAIELVGEWLQRTLA